MKTRDLIGKFFCVMATVLAVSAQVQAGEFAVSPMMIELAAEGRSEQAFTFNLYGKSDTEVKLSLYEMNQLETGYMGFTPAVVSNQDALAAWVKLDQDTYRLRDGETTVVNGQVRVPARAVGTHSLAVMVEEILPEETSSGVNVQIRYAVILNLNVAGRTQRIETVFNELAVVQKDGETFLQGNFVNNSSIENWLFSEVQLRDANNRLLERIPLKTQSAWQRADSGSRVFPGASVAVFGKITKPFTPGTYKVLVRNSFADKAQPVYRDDIYLKEPEAAAAEVPEEEVAAAPAEGGVQVSPGLLEVQVRDNGTSFTTFYIENNDSRELQIELPSELAGAQELGVAEFKFFPAQVKLQPKQKARIVLNQKHVDGVPYGNASFEARVLDGSNSLVAPLVIRTAGGA